MSFNDWSTTASSNASVGAIVWSEGQLPSTVNNSARAQMADLAEIRDGTTVATGWHVKANGLCVRDQTDTTKKVIFDVSSVSAGSTRTIGFQNAPGTIAFVGDTPSANTVPNSSLAQMNPNTIKGNNTGSTVDAKDLTVAQTTAMLAAVVGDSGSGGTKGLVPAPSSGDAAAGKALAADGTWKAVGGLLQFSAGTAIGLSSGTTLFLATGIFAGGESVFVRIPVACVISHLAVQTNVAPGSGKTYTFTVRKNATSDTALTCTVADNTNVGSDNTHSVTLTAGDFICLKAVAGTGAATSDSVYASVLFSTV